MFVTFEKYSDDSLKSADDRIELENEIDVLLKNCWGAFPKDFIQSHIFKAHTIMVARAENACVAFCAISIKKILGRTIHYVEFLIVDKPFQKSGLGSFLFFWSIKEELLKSFLNLLLGKPMIIFFITPNVRVVSRIARFADFTYPNPHTADSLGTVPPADEETWLISRELLKNSDNPGRELSREGLVIKQSYVNTPWLIYNNDTAPWHSSEKINIFARKYLGYHTGEDKELMVRAHLDLFSTIRYLLNI